MSLLIHLPQSPRSRLGREREAGPARRGHLGRDPDREGVDPQRWQAHADLSAAGGIVDGVSHDALDAREVGRRQRCEADLVVPRAAETVADHGAYLLLGPLAHRTGDHPGLTEAAAPRAAAEDLDVEAVVHDLGQRDELVLGVGPVGQVGDRALGHLGGHIRVARRDGHEGGAVVGGLVHRGDVDTRDRGQGPEHALAAARSAPSRLPVPHDLGDLADGLLAVADHEEVDEVGQWLGVVRAVAPGADEGVLRGPRRRPDRDAGEVDAVQDVRVDELGRQVEGQHVELGGVAMGLHGEQRQAVRAHEGLEVEPGRVGTLGDGVVALVQDLLEDLQALVGEADLVGVGIDQQPGHVVRRVDRVDGPVFAADVAGRLLHLGQERLEPWPQRSHVDR